MARVLTKKSTVAAKVPLATDLEIGELAVNTADGKLYTKHSDNTVKQLGIATNDSRLTDAREWTASTVTQAEAEVGIATTRRAWTAQRVFQAVAAWWAASADKTKLDGIQAGAQVNVGTNLAQGTRTTTAVPVTSSTGTGATLGAATTSLAGVMTAADKTKLDGVATGATANATDAQLRDRATHTGSQAISTVTGLQTALDGKISTTERGVSGGIPTLDEFARIPASQLPSYVDDVLEYPTREDFPATGEGGKIYIAVNQGTQANPTRQYRWTGSVYAEINPSPGTTDALTEGSTNLYFSEHRVRNTVLTGLSLAVSTAVTAADSVLSAIGKIQAKLNTLGTAAFANLNALPSAVVITGTTAVALTVERTTAAITNLSIRFKSAVHDKYLGLDPNGDFAFSDSDDFTGGLGKPFWHAGNLIKQTRVDDLDAGRVVLAETVRRRLSGGFFSIYCDRLILLHPLYTSTLLPYSIVDGKITATRGGIASLLNQASVEIVSTSAYNGHTTAFYEIMGNNAEAWQAVSCTYQGVKYAALIVPYQASAYDDGIFFEGRAVSDDVNQLLCIEYYNRQTATVLNAEVYNSIAPLTVQKTLRVGGETVWHTGNFNPATKQDKSSIVTTATSRTLAMTDAWNYLRPGTTSAITLTVPTNASVAFEIGTEITVRALGNVTLAAASGVTLNAPSGGTLNMTARMTVTLKKVGTNEWDVIGQTVAA